MRIDRLISTCATASLLLVACGDDSNSKERVNVIVDSGADAAQPEAGDPELCPAGDAGVTITKSTLEGSLLTLQLEFGGGCKEHSFSIGWGGAAATSDPPQIPLELNHYGHGDSCDALLTRSIVIDLSSIGETITPARIDLIDPDGKVIIGATSVFYEGSKPGEKIPDDALKIRRECAHAVF